MTRSLTVGAMLVLILMCEIAVGRTEEKGGAGMSIDKDKKTITIDCKIAPRKIDAPGYNDIYPIEVIACWPFHKEPGKGGQKAHETVVVFDNTLKPSAIHKAIESLGLKPGKPAKGEDAKAEGPEVRISLEIPGANGSPQRVPIEKTLVDKKSGKPLPTLKWRFTGSALKQPDPEKDDKVFGADMTGTLIAVFPVTDETVIQTDLTLKEEKILKLETNQGLLPKEGTAVKLIIEVK